MIDQPTYEFRCSCGAISRGHETRAEAEIAAELHWCGPGVPRGTPVVAAEGDRRCSCGRLARAASFDGTLCPACQVRIGTSS